MNDDAVKSQDGKSANIMMQIAKWASFYRANPVRFIKEHLMIKLKFFQEILITCMWFAPYIFIVACRGISKTWCTALFASVKCMLYPGTACIVASGTRKQARELIQKITKDFMINYPMFAFEIEDIENNQYSTIVKFKCGSTIEVVTANENARCGRGNMLIIDEARLVDKGIIDSVLSKFLTAQRHAGYMDRDEYQDLPLERNQRIYLTSAWYANHWCATSFKEFAGAMIVGNDDYFACALPYQLSVKERLLDKRDIEEEMSHSDFNEVSWIMEMCAEFWTGANGSLYKYEEIYPYRNITYAFYPKECWNLIPESKMFKVPEPQKNEIRILSADIALMQSKKNSGNNDATSIFLNSMIVNPNGGRSKKRFVFTKNSEGLRVEEQALEIRRLMDDFNVDWIVIDARGLGLPVVDMLMSNMYDAQRGIMYPAVDCYNNEEVSARCKVPGAPKKLWAMLANNDINSQCALTLREEFRQGNIDLLVNEDTYEEIFSSIPGYNGLPLYDQIMLKAPYINTTLAINELISLETEIKGNYVKVKEASGARKDRYSSLGYNIYVSNIIEAEMESQASQEFNISDYLYFKQPVL